MECIRNLINPKRSSVTLFQDIAAWMKAHPEDNVVGLFGNVWEINFSGYK